MKGRKLSMRSKRISKLSICMICGYVLSFMSLFLPLIVLGDNNITFKDVFFLEESDIGLLGNILGDKIQIFTIEKILIFMVAILAINGIILFSFEICGRIRYGVAVLSAVLSAFFYFKWFILLGVTLTIGKIVNVGLGLKLEMILQIVMMCIPLAALCQKQNSDTRNIEDSETTYSKKESDYIEERTIEILSGNDAGMEIPIGVGDCIILGRNSEECNVVISGDKISRKHCEVSLTEDGYYVTDYSSNGTYLSDGTRVDPFSPVLVQFGTKIFLGDRKNIFYLR